MAAEPSLFTPGALNADYSSLNILALGAVIGGNITGALTEGETRIGRSSNGYGAIYIPANCTVSISHTVPENVKLYLEHGAVVTVANNKTLTLNGGYAGSGSFAGPGTVTIKNVEKIDVRDFGVKVNSANGYATELSRALTAAGGVTFGSTARGVDLSFPPGLINIDAQIAPASAITNVRLLGAGGRTWSTSKFGGTVLKFALTNTPMFDLGSAVSTDVTFEKLGLAGTSSTDPTNHAIYSASLTRLSVINCNFDTFGGSAIKLDAGANTFISGIQTDNCLKGFASLAAAQGAVHLGGGESHIDYSNINGPYTIGSTHNAVGAGASLLAAAVYINGAPGSYNNVVAAAADVGFHIGTGVGSDSSYYFACRGEFNQTYGFWIEGALNKFVACQAGNNSQDTDNTFDGFYTKHGIAGFPFENEFIGCHVLGTSGASYQQRYAFTDDNSSVSNTLQNVNRYDSTCRLGNNVRGRKFNIVGADIPMIAPSPFTQAGTLDTVPSPDELTFDGEKGNIWRAAIASGAATKILATNLLPGQIYTLYIVQPASAGTVTLDTVFAKIATFTSPANSKQLTGQFYCDGTSLYQVGAWSGDM